MCEKDINNWLKQKRRYFNLWAPEGFMKDRNLQFLFENMFYGRDDVEYE